MNINLKGKTAIVTGASGGIGHAICRKYIAAGANIVAVDVRRESSEKLIKELVYEGGSAIFIEGDVSDKQSMQNMCKQALKEYGKIDILVNNAGVNVKKEGRKKIHEFSDDDWKRIIDIDLCGVFYCSKPVIHSMIEKRRRQDSQHKFGRRTGTVQQTSAHLRRQRRVLYTLPKLWQ